MYILSAKKHFLTLLTHYKDFQTIYNNLKSSDTCFSSVPISNSEDSKNLRSAHAQRVISSYLQRIIWQPFSSEKLIQQENIISLLKDIEKELSTPLTLAVVSVQQGSGQHLQCVLFNPCHRQAKAFPLVGPKSSLQIPPKSSHL